MAIVVGDVGCDEFLKVYFNGVRPAGGNDLSLRLYTNDYTPLQTSQNNAFTEADGGGYEAKTLTHNNWTVNPESDPSDAVYGNQTFTFSGNLAANASVYGYFVTDGDNTFIWGERFGTAFTPGNNGDNITIAPKFQMSTGTPS
jgi:hypothetical protein